MNRTIKALIEQNDAAELKLDEDSLATVKKMASYMRLPKLGILDRELVRRDMIAMALEAQSRGEAFTGIIGPDQKAWCDEVSGSLGGTPPAEHFLTLLRFLSGYFTYLSLLLFSGVLGNAGWTAKVKTGHLLIALLVVAFRLWETYLIPRVAFGTWSRALIYLLLPLAAAVIWFLTDRVAPLLEITVFTVPTLLLVGGLLLLYAAACLAFGVYCRRQVANHGLAI